MKFAPNAIILYVENIEKSSIFYQDLLGIKPEEASPTFHSFQLSNGMDLGLKAKHTVIPPADEHVGVELAFTVANKQKVDELFAQWQAKNITLLLPLTVLPFGYTFVGLDPDGNRLRVVSLGTA